VVEFEKLLVALNVNVVVALCRHPCKGQQSSEEKNNFFHRNGGLLLSLLIVGFYVLQRYANSSK
jgi:hypothetical protein